MKITSVDVFLLTTGQPAYAGALWNPICIRANTDEGISGFGEAGMCYGDSQKAAFGICQDFGKLIIGRDPMDTDSIFETLFRSTFWGMGGGGVIFSGISAMDIALMDIKGKALGVPVYQLIGGKRNTKLRTYASQIQFDWGKTCRVLKTPQEFYDVTKKALADGYNCIKVDPVAADIDGNFTWLPHGGLLEYKKIKLACDRVAAIRDAGGPDLDIIIELHALTDTNTAIQLGRELEEFRIFYYEEPVHPLNHTSMKEIASKVNIPIAGGERIYSRWGYRPFFEDRSLHIIQPDLCNTGGISEGKRICDMAYVYDVGVQIHVCGSPISTAAALQVEAAIPNFVIHEHHQAAMLDANIGLCTHNYQPKDGYFEVPDLPGIGQELTQDTMDAAVKVTLR